MWTRRFLLTGLFTGALLVGLTFVAMWPVMSLMPHGLGVLAGLAVPCVVGLIIYPPLWYVLIHRRRDYSGANTLRLVAYSYAGPCAITILGMLAGMLYPSEAVVSTGGWGWATLLEFAEVLMAAVVAAVMVAIPYVIIAGPLAFVHRLLMLRFFARPGAEPAAPDTPRT
jgi:hypothetical protein